MKAPGGFLYSLGAFFVFVFPKTEKRKRAEGIISKKKVRFLFAAEGWSKEE
jgi:hypothetical protein